MDGCNLWSLVKEVDNGASTLKCCKGGGECGWKVVVWDMLGRTRGGQARGGRQLSGREGV
jgi:hypothetical protein